MTTPARTRGTLRIAELPAVAAAASVAVVVEIGLRVTTLPRLASFLGTPLDLEESTHEAASVPDGPAAEILPAASKRRVRATRRVLRHWPFGDTCLRQALISGSLLRRHRPKLQVGVAKTGDEVRAHAWLVIQGAVLDPLRSASSYLSLTTVPTGLDR